MIVVIENNISSSERILSTLLSKTNSLIFLKLFIFSEKRKNIRRKFTGDQLNWTGKCTARARLQFPPLLRIFSLARQTKPSFPVLFSHWRCRRSKTCVAKGPCYQPSKIKSVSPHSHVISSMYIIVIPSFFSLLTETSLSTFIWTTFNFC